MGAQIIDLARERARRQATNLIPNGHAVSCVRCPGCASTLTLAMPDDRSIDVPCAVCRTELRFEAPSGQVRR